MNPRHRTRAVIVALIASLALVAAACGTDDSVGQEDKLTIVATTTIWGDVVEQIVGDDANVEVLTPVGTDPHDFEASSQQVALIQQADLVVANGLGLEEGLVDILEAAAEDGVNVFEVAPLLNPIPFGEEGGNDHDDHGDEGDHDEESEHHDEDGDHDDHGDEGGHDDHDHDGDDPHVWMDPDRMALGVSLIADELLDLDPDGPWQDRANDYIAQLGELDEDLLEGYAALSEDARKMVTNHDALGYFAERYEFEIVGTVIPGGSTLSDPSSQELTELVHTMEDENVNVIYGETTEPSALAEAVAAELGEDVAVVELFTGSLGEPGGDADSYIGMMRENARRIIEANS